MKHLLSSTAFIVLNKGLAREIGLKEAVLLADLISKEEYFIANGMTDGWFFNTEANIEADTTLNSYHQRKCLKTLKNRNLIVVKRKGIPAKQYFKINEDQVLQILTNLSVKKQSTINKNKEIKIINNISQRQARFEDEVFNLEPDNNISRQFFLYWSELNRSKTKMKWELENTWDLKKRISRWKANQKKWDKPKAKSMSKIDAQLNEYLKGKEYL